MNRWTRLAMLVYPRRWRQRYGMEFEALVDSGLLGLLMRHVFTGVFVGDTVGLGVEIADLLELARSRASRPAGSGTLQ